jgi:hypothetical protein
MSTRKSSIGAARRAQQRAHLPFHADNLRLGKKTGLPIPTVEHKSDDFEPFDEILSHAATRPAWNGRNKRPGSGKKRKSLAPLYGDDEDDGGEMSMELEDYGELCRVHVVKVSRELNNARRTYRYEREWILFQRAATLITFSSPRWVIFASRRTCVARRFRRGAFSPSPKVTYF